LLRVDDFKVGRLMINGKVYVRDIVIRDNRTIELREMRSSSKLTERYGHAPVTTAENLPWSCDTLIIGTGSTGGLFVLEEVHARAHEMGVTIITKPTSAALLHMNDPNTNLVLHITS